MLWHYRTLGMLSRFFAVHDSRPGDRIYPDNLRLIAHADPEKAIVWQVVKHEDNQYLQIKANRASTNADTTGWYLAIPPNSDRDLSSNCNYVGVHPDIEKAMTIVVIPMEDY